MTLTLKEVEHIALLARLELSDAEKQRYQQQLSHILEHVAQLQKLDTSHTEPAPGALPKGARLRADEPKPGLTVRPGAGKRAFDEKRTSSACRQ